MSIFASIIHIIIIMTEEEYNEISKRIIGAAIEVHKILGPGLLEYAYQKALFHEMQLRNIKCQREVELPITYKGMELQTNYRMDMLVEDEVVVEIKSTEYDNILHRQQLLTYLRLSGKKLGLLINVNKPTLTKGVTRVVNDF